ncbi:DUF7577 domain-containing protein [Vibrio sp. AK197]
MVKIYIGESPVDAHIVCGLLNTDLIDCEVRGDALFSIQGEVPFDDSTAPYIWLNEPSQHVKAKRIIKEFMTYKTRHKADWHCMQCGELNEGNFAICWQCGEPYTPNSVT